MKSLDDKLNKSKILLEGISKNNKKLKQKKNAIDSRLKKTPLELSKLKKEMKALNQLLTIQARKAYSSLR